MPLDDLLTALEREAHATADRLRADAQDEVARLLATADDSITTRRDRSVQARMIELRAAMEREVGHAGREARRSVLLARAAFLERVTNGLRTALPGTIDRADYRATVPARLAAALQCVDNETVQIHCSPPLVALIEHATADRPHVTVTAGDEGGTGFHVAAADGSVEIDDTLESRLAASVDVISRAAISRLPTSA